jgi:hypothetical protein
MKTSITIAGRHGRDLKSGPLEYKAGVLTTRPRGSVVLRSMFEVKSNKFSRGRKGCIMTSFVTYTLLVILGRSSQRH